MIIIAKLDLCKEIKKGDIVEIVPEYSYMLGSDVRIKDYFNIRPTEVVIKKTKKSDEKDEVTLIKCKRDDLDMKK